MEREGKMSIYPQSYPHYPHFTMKTSLWTLKNKVIYKWFHNRLRKNKCDIMKIFWKNQGLDIKKNMAWTISFIIHGVLDSTEL